MAEDNHDNQLTQVYLKMAIEMEEGRISCSLAVLNTRVGHTMDVLSPFISVLCHSD